MLVLPYKEKQLREKKLIENDERKHLIRCEEKAQAIAREVMARFPVGSRIVMVVSDSPDGCALLASARMLEAAGFVPLVLESWGNRVSSLFRFLRNLLVQRGVLSFRLSSRSQWMAFQENASRAVACLVSFPLEWKGRVSREVFGEWMVHSVLRLIAIETPAEWADEGIAMHETWCLDALVAEVLDYPLREYAGEIRLLTSFFPVEVLERGKRRWYRSTPEEVAMFVRPRYPHTHKNSYGRLLIVGGSQAYPGACRLAAQGALQSGCGLVTLACEESVIGHDDEVTYLVLPQAKEIATLEAYLQKLHTTAILVGNGWGNDESRREILRYILQQPYVKRIVIDADGLNLLARFEDLLEILTLQDKVIVLTPHVGEAVRLCRVSPDVFRSRRKELVLEMAKKWGVTLCQKDAVTLVATPDGELWFSDFGNHALAKGGSGDVLAGLIGGLIASGYEAKEAALVAAYLLGKSAEIFVEEFPAEASRPHAILSLLPQAWKSLYEYGKLYKKRVTSLEQGNDPWG